jgi:hypothetical protein
MSQGILFSCKGGTVTVPTLPLNRREDGGHLLVNPPRDVWERSELSPDELTQWSFLVAATGRAMLDVLPQLEGGCVNYWEAGNWALHDSAAPAGAKVTQHCRRVHLHIFGRSRFAEHKDWQWGESPKFPDFVDSKKWAADFLPFNQDECTAVVARIDTLLTQKYAVVRSW